MPMFEDGVYEARLADERRRMTYGVVEMLAWLVLLFGPSLFGSGCAPRPPAPMTPTAAALVVTPYCVAMLVLDDGVEVVGRVCTDSAWSCGRVRGAAIRWGHLAGIVEVGLCGGIHEAGRGVETTP
jgi:hypothetical protein